MATKMFYRRVGETGNPLAGILNNDDGTLTVPEGATVTLTGTRVDTGAVVIDGNDVAIVDRAARSISYAFRDADLATPCVMLLVFAIVPTDNKPTYVPDTPKNEIRLTVYA